MTPGGSYIVEHCSAGPGSIRVPDLGSDHVHQPSVLSELVAKRLSVSKQKSVHIFFLFFCLFEKGHPTYPLPVLEPQPAAIDPPSGRIRK